MEKISPDILQLLEEVKKSLKPNKNDIDYNDKTQFKYAMYARKSTEGENRQKLSVQHQIDDCKKQIIKRYGINNFDEKNDIFKEDKSAKKSGERGAFNAMIKAIKKGQYNGIIAWHYDRLARNMKEAGEIIDMVDNGQIQDLLFVTSTFERSATGLMTLGVSFVLSKHYSDHLSENVLRGNNKRTEAGIVLDHRIHGYRITREGKLIEDDENWRIIKKAFRMRIDENATYTEIAEFLNNSNYQVYRRNNQGRNRHEDFTFTKQSVEVLLKTPFYAGVYSYGGIVVPSEKCCIEEFNPMLTPQEYREINPKTLLHSNIRHRAPKRTERNVSDFLRQVVKCAHCGNYMGTTVVNPNTRGSFRFRCDNKGCTMYGKGFSGAIIRDFVIDFLEKHSFANKLNYERYLEDREKDLQREVKEKEKKKANLKRKIEEDKKILNGSTKKFGAGIAPDIINEDIIRQQKDELKRDEDELKETEEDLRALKEAPMTISEFLELYENTGEILRLTNSMHLADEIIKIFFLNIEVKVSDKTLNQYKKQWSVVNYKLRPPFDELVENTECHKWSG